jgi:hypothetical protein
VVAGFGGQDDSLGETMSEYTGPTAAQMIRMFQTGQLTRDQFFYLAQQLSEDETAKLADLLLRWVNPPTKTD